MSNASGTAARRALLAFAALAALAGAIGPARPADLGEGRGRYGPGYGQGDRKGLGPAAPACAEEPTPPRFFPREEGDSNPPRPRRLARRCPTACIPRRVAIPTDLPDDPSYVGSTYGLGKPSYYGFKPALGVDDPFGRPLLPYCP